jgi:hypothetical protein
MQKLIPLLKKARERPRNYAVVYETFNGMRTLYEEAITILSSTKEDFLGFSLGDEYQYAQSKTFFLQYDRKRKEQGIKTRLIALEKQRQFMKPYEMPSFSIRYLPYSLPHGVIIYGDVVATLLWTDNPTAFAIHSRENANAYKKFFEDLWKIAKK